MCPIEYISILPTIPSFAVYGVIYYLSTVFSLMMDILCTTFPYNLEIGDMYRYPLIVCRSLTHWSRVAHICVGKQTIIGSDNGLSPGRRQAIIWTNAGILLIGPLGTNLSEFLIVIQTFSFNEMHLKMSSAKWRPFCLGLNVLKNDIC